MEKTIGDILGMMSRHQSLMGKTSHFYFTIPSSRVRFTRLSSCGKSLCGIWGITLNLFRNFLFLQWCFVSSVNKYKSCLCCRQQQGPAQQWYHDQTCGRRKKADTWSLKGLRQVLPASAQHKTSRDGPCGFDSDSVWRPGESSIISLQEQKNF